jgi:hypothetical protein
MRANSRLAGASSSAHWACIEAILRGSRALAFADTPGEIGQAVQGRDVHDLAKREMRHDADERDLDEAQGPISGQGCGHGVRVFVEVTQAVLKCSARPWARRASPASFEEYASLSRNFSKPSTFSIRRR